jgi:hypothetical protein
VRDVFRWTLGSITANRTARYGLREGRRISATPRLPSRCSITALSVETHLPEVAHGVPEDDDQPGEGCGEQRRPEASELSSAVFILVALLLLHAGTSFVR